MQHFFHQTAAKRVVKEQYTHYRHKQMLELTHIVYTPMNTNCNTNAIDLTTKDRGTQTNNNKKRQRKQNIYVKKI